MRRSAIAFEDLFDPRHREVDPQGLRAWCDALPVGEPVVASLGVERSLDDAPTLTVRFTARAHVLDAEGGDAFGGAWSTPVADPSSGSDLLGTDLSGSDVLAASGARVARLEKLEPGEFSDVWAGTAAEVSAHVLQLVFDAAAFLARVRLHGSRPALEIVVSAPAVAEVFGEAPRLSTP
jgi:hypothetical protein